jgi:hypothetical protein
MSHHELPVVVAGSRAPERPSTATASRATKALIGVGIAHALLAATHGGEFWPFSIYPMFSKAGRPWARALVIEASPSPLRRQLDAQYGLDDLPGTPLGLEALGIPQNDVSSLVQRADHWGVPEIAALQHLFGSLPCQHALIVLVVRGMLAKGAVQYVATPVGALQCAGDRVSVERPDGRHLAAAEESVR